jgi:hypothetical protein
MATRPRTQNPGRHAAGPVILIRPLSRSRSRSLSPPYHLHHLQRRQCSLFALVAMHTT